MRISLSSPFSRPFTTTVGIDTGWRHWLVENGTLVAPFAFDELPETGIATNAAFYATREDVDKATHDVDRTRTALTYGTVTGVSPDTRRQLYDINGRWVKLPDCYVADTYTVAYILTDAHGLRCGDIPIRPWTTP